MRDQQLQQGFSHSLVHLLTRPIGIGLRLPLIFTVIHTHHSKSNIPHASPFLVKMDSPLGCFWGCSNIKAATDFLTVHYTNLEFNRNGRRSSSYYKHRSVKVMKTPPVYTCVYLHILFYPTSKSNNTSRDMKKCY